MPHSKPRISSELQILSYLNARMDLLPRDKKNLHNLEKGYEGELKFSQLLKGNLNSQSISIYDLRLESNQTEFQIDNLLIYQNTIYLNEVKYYEGDFFIRGDKWYVATSEKEIRNPMLQLQRSEFLLRQTLQQTGANFNVKARLIFVHPEFTLYQAPFDHSFIFPTQLNQYIRTLNSTPSTLTSKHHNLAKQLIRRHITTSRHERIPDYHFDNLEKGIVCGSCRGFMFPIRLVMLRCKRCGHEERTDLAVMRSVAEFHWLFPDRRINTSSIYEWCEKIITKKRIQRILVNNLQLVRNGKYSYYVFNRLPLL